MFFVCRMVAVLCFLIASYSGLQDIQLYLNEGRYIGITVAQLWKTYATNSFYAFYHSMMPDIPALRLLIEDALQQPAWAVFLVLFVVIFLTCARRRKYHSRTRRY